MKSIYFNLLPAGTMIEVIEHPLLRKPWPDEDGKMMYRALSDRRDNKIYVHNIYAYVFSVFGIDQGARACCTIAKAHLYSLIDNMGKS